MADADFAGDLPEEMEGELEDEDPEALKQKLAELDAEAEKLKEDTTKMEEELKGGGANTPGSKEEADSRSVYVGNVRTSQTTCPCSLTQTRFCGACASRQSGMSAAAAAAAATAAAAKNIKMSHWFILLFCTFSRMYICVRVCVCALDNP